MQNQPIGWVKTKGAGIGYCSLGRHFTKDGDTVWAYFRSPLVSTMRACEKCAKEATTDEQA